MRKAQVYRNGVLAGYLIEEDPKFFVFIYDDHYFNDINKPAISLTLAQDK